MLYGVAQASLEETGGGEGVEVLQNEPYKDHPLFEDGRFAEVSTNNLFKLSSMQYTRKTLHMDMN